MSAENLAYEFLVEMNKGEKAPDGLFDGVEVLDQDAVGRAIIKCTREQGDRVVSVIYNKTGHIFAIPRDLSVQPITKLADWDAVMARPTQ